MIEASAHIDALDVANTATDDSTCADDSWQVIDRDALRERAERTLSALPRPFLRWAGSKRWMLPHIVDLLPDRFRTYVEPFLGGGSLFFLVEPERAQLSDVCAPLIEAFEGVRDDPETVITELMPLTPDRERYYEIRSRRREMLAQRAADFIYLNKTCWNGLYLVNSNGNFNVPYGRPKSDGIFSPLVVRACAQALSKPDVKVSVRDFEATLDGIGSGDVAFVDPPYVTGHNNNGFIDYNETLFAWKDQVRLAKKVTEVAARGACVIVTNANHADLRSLYPSFDILAVSRTSTIASKSTKRGPVEEILIHSRH